MATRGRENVNNDDPERQIHRALINLLTNPEAFRPLNVPNVPMFRRGRMPAAAAATAAPNQPQQNAQHGTFHLYTPCLHEQTVYKSPGKVPIKVCDECSSVVVPETAHSVVARALPLPHSMRQDERWPQLFEIFEQHREMLGEVERLVEQQEHLLIRLYRWREAYSRNTLVDFGGKNSPIFGVLENSVKRTSNATIGFQQTVESMLVETRRRMVKQVNRCIPRSMKDFVYTAKKLVVDARPTALYHPNASETCTVCEEKRCNVVLYGTRSQQDRRADLRSFIFSQSDEPPAVERFCTCKKLRICLDCLLEWYWESSEQLKKTFANCPSCRAEFHLEDILPIYEGPQSSNDTTVQRAASATTENNQEYDDDDDGGDGGDDGDGDGDDDDDDDDDGLAHQQNPFLIGLDSTVHVFEFQRAAEHNSDEPTQPSRTTRDTIAHDSEEAEQMEGSE